MPRTPQRCSFSSEILCPAVSKALDKSIEITSVNSLLSITVMKGIFASVRTVQKPENFRILTRFEPVTSRCLCDALSYEATDGRSWSFTGSKFSVMNEWMDEMIYEMVWNLLREITLPRYDGGKQWMPSSWTNEQCPMAYIYTIRLMWI